MIAHRGSSDEHAEHTAQAYRRAIDDGADGLECDVRLTADGVPVCMHDRRIDRTSDGTGIVSTRTYAELAERDYSSWKSTDAEAGPGLLRLDDLIDIVLAAGRPLELAIETKHPVRYGGLVEERVVALLSRRRLVGPNSPIRVRMMSFSVTALRRVKAATPGLPTVFLMDRVPVRCRSGWLPAGSRAAGPQLSILRAHPDYVNRVHSAGGEVHAWVVDQPDEIDLCARLGVDVIITNRPKQVRDRLRAR
ncbi:MAG: glycerophosphodiester phosphodiesterase family protein [Candidatus Nanopelagicales bacterium]|nr:glycerophosphodiester phosphodiesterase family protein [Candidatus Nanopelagicales bacterium]